MLIDTFCLYKDTGLLLVQNKIHACSNIANTHIVHITKITTELISFGRFLVFEIAQSKYPSHYFEKCIQLFLNHTVWKQLIILLPFTSQLSINKMDFFLCCSDIVKHFSDQFKINTKIQLKTINNLSQVIYKKNVYHIFGVLGYQYSLNFLCPFI